ncbi:hypothetical protein [Nocardia australiensis]|uniref:hypothetical protein n=1 Tax=Nocardia australiensis TaxID=2887191 RepID=UPI001D1416BF|nr:hypothetical protein [Nocardia australiensis]
MSRAALNVIVAASIALTVGAGVANAAPSGIPLEPAPSNQVAPVGAQGDSIGVSPGSSSAAELACLVQSISAGARYCMS